MPHQNRSISSRSKEPKYQRLADELRHEIEAGKYDSQLPTIVQTADARGVALVTVQKAYQQLKDDGIIRTQRGRGSFISQRQRKKSYLLGAFTHGRGPLCLRAVGGMRTLLSGRREELLFRHYDAPNEDPIEALEQLLEEHRLDGVVVLPGNAVDAQDFCQLLRGYGVPFAIISYVPLYGLGDVPIVVPNEKEVVSQVLQHLISQGRKRIMFLHSREIKSGRLLPGLHTAIRYQDYCRILRDNSLPFGDAMQILDDLFEDTGKLRELKELVQSSDAVFCDTQGAAHRLIRICLDLGISIPRDLAVVAMNDDAVLARMGISAVDMNFEEVGAKGMELLLKEIDEESSQNGTFEVDVKFTIRLSSFKCRR